MEFNGTFFVTIISFLAFVFIMNKLLYEPINKIVNERNNFIDSNYQHANENNAKADELSKEMDEKIIGSREEGRNKYNKIVLEYKEQKTNIVKDAQDKSRAELDEAYSKLKNVSDEAKENLKWKISDLANDIVEKVIGCRSEVQDFDNDKINKILYQ